MAEAEETIIGNHTGKSYNLIASQHRTYQCPNCRKQIHCLAGFEKEGDPVELLKDICGKNCACKCRTHYVAKNGRLKKYGTVDDTTSIDDFPEARERDETDDFIDEINSRFNKSRS